MSRVRVICWGAWAAMNWAVLLHECDREGAIQVAEKINKRLAEIKCSGLGANHQVSASIGIVVFSEAKMDVEQLLANADIAMYQAKKKGGAGWHLYSEGEGVHEERCRVACTGRR
jgi:diguanylate cyclase (GGDEF)-like protein